MKRLFILAVLAGMMGAIGPASAMVLFFDDFEDSVTNSSIGTLSSTNWLGAGTGQIVDNPDTGGINPSDRVLNFSALGSGGDLFSSALIALTPGQQYLVEFDYYGESATAGTSGGFAGLANGPGTGSSPAGEHIWYAGTTSATTASIDPITLLDLDDWIHISYTFTSPITVAVGNSIRLIFEDFSGSGPGAVPLDAFFDNVQLSSVPLPAALPLYGTGLAIMGFIGWRRKRNKAAVV